MGTILFVVKCALGLGWYKNSNRVCDPGGLVIAILKSHERKMGRVVILPALASMFHWWRLHGPDLPNGVRPAVCDIDYSRCRPEILLEVHNLGIACLLKFLPKVSDYLDLHP